MTIYASCGHAVQEVGDLILVEFDDEDIDHDAGRFVPVVVSGAYCPKCAAEGVASGRFRLLPRT